MAFFSNMIAKMVGNHFSLKMSLPFSKIKLRIELIKTMDKEIHDHSYCGTAIVLAGEYVETLAHFVLKLDINGAVIIPSEFVLSKTSVTRKKNDKIKITYNTKHQITKLVSDHVWIAVIETDHRNTKWGFWTEDNGTPVFTPYR